MARRAVPDARRGSNAISPVCSTKIVSSGLVEVERLAPADDE